MPNEYREDVLQEFRPVANLRVRTVKPQRGPAKLDIREFIQGDSFQGFTKRGIRLDLDAVRTLRDVLEDVLAHIERRPARVADPDTQATQPDGFEPEEQEAPRRVEPSHRIDRKTGRAIPIKPKAAAPARIAEPTATATDRPRTVAQFKEAARRGEHIAITGPDSLAEAIARERHQGNAADAVQRASDAFEASQAAKATPTQPQDMRPILDDILDATQKQMAGMVEAMPPAVQAKRETQKRLDLDGSNARFLRGMLAERDAKPQAPAPVAPAAPQAQPAARPVKPGKMSLSDMAALL